MIKAPGDFSGQFDVRHLILADRHMGGFVDQNIGALQYRITEKPVSRQIALFKLFLLIFVAGHPLQPPQGSDH